jgi:hypothetical protein
MRESVSGHENRPNLGERTGIAKSFFMPVGTPLQVEVEGVIPKMNSMAVGYSRDEYLIIKYPSAKGLGPISHKLSKGARITVRYITEGNVFGFQSEVIAVMSDLYRFLLISYPTVIARHSLRKSRRIECYLPAELRTMRSRLAVEVKEDNTLVMDIIYKGIIIDISQFGCNFEVVEESSDRHLPDLRVDDPVNIYVQLPGIEVKIELCGFIRRINRDTRRIGTGIQFAENDEEAKSVILDYISVLEKLAPTV